MVTNIGHDFMRKTRYEFLGPTDQMQGVSQPPLELPYDESARMIELPAVDISSREAPQVPEVIARRRSVRRYADRPLAAADLSFLLWATQGITRIMPGRATFRTVPSAGARHALETYVLVNRVQDIPASLYRYVASRHALILVDATADVAARAVKGCVGQEFVQSCAATFVWAAVPYRMTWRYGQRGYRYLHLDAGHVGQNLYLAAEAIGCGACAIAAFDDEAMNHLVGADGDEVFVIYVTTVGYPQG